jgi:DNA-binding PadR family transcriptional regulator
MRTKMKLLTRIEEIILLSILKLGKEAYGVSIREQILKDTDEKWSFASIYPPLENLKRRRLVIRTKGEPSPERGGKSKYFYEVTSEGRGILKESYKSHQKMWTGAKEILWDLNGKKQ